MTENKSSAEKIVKQITQSSEGFIFIGHGKSNYKYPDLSSLEVSIFNKNSGESEYLKMYLKDFIKVKKSTLKTVILIGCETASGRVYGSTGMAGIQQGFTLLGAANVVGTLWEIDSYQSLEQLKHYVRELNQIKNPALALQKFQIATLHKLRSHQYFKYPHPYFWGGYTLYSRGNQDRRKL